MAPTPPPKPIPPALSHLIIFNPTLKPSPQRPSALPRASEKTEVAPIEEDDVREAAQILFYHSADGETSRDTVLRQFGLAKGLMGFTDMATASAEGFYAIHSYRRRLLIWSPEKDFYVYVNLRLAFRQSSEPDGKLEPVSNAQGLVDEMIVAELRRACDDFRLLHGPLDHLANPAVGHQQKMSSFWTEWAGSFDRKSLNLRPEDALRQWMGGFGPVSDTLTLRAQTALSTLQAPSDTTTPIEYGILSPSGPVHETSSECDPPLLRFLIRQLLAALPPPTPHKFEPSDPASQRQHVGFGFSLRRKRDPSGLSGGSPAASDRKNSWNLGLGNATAWIPGIGSSRSGTPTPASAPTSATKNDSGAHERKQSTASSGTVAAAKSEGVPIGEGKARWPSWGLSGIGDAVGTVGAAIGLGSSPTTGGEAAAGPHASGKDTAIDPVKPEYDTSLGQGLANVQAGTLADDFAEPDVDLPDLQEAVGSDTASQYDWEQQIVWLCGSEDQLGRQRRLQWVIRDNLLLYQLSDVHDSSNLIPAHLISALFRDLSDIGASHRPSLDSPRLASSTPTLANSSLHLSNSDLPPTVDSRGQTVSSAAAQVFVELRRLLTGDASIVELQARTTWSQYIGATRSANAPNDLADELYVLVGKQDANLVDADQAMRSAARQYGAPVAV